MCYIEGVRALARAQINTTFNVFHMGAFFKSDLGAISDV